MRFGLENMDMDAMREQFGTIKNFENEFALDSEDEVLEDFLDYSEENEEEQSQKKVRFSERPESATSKFSSRLRASTAEYDKFYAEWDDQ